MRVPLNHLLICMAEYLLEFEQVTTFQYPMAGKGVPEVMKAHPG